MSKKMKKIDWLAAQEYTVLRIDVPRNNDRSPLAAEQMFAAIHGIFSESAKFQNHLSFEIVARDKFIQFYLYLPIHLKDFVEGQIYAQYPSVEIHEVDDYAQQVNVVSKSYAVCELALNKPEVYPIKQFTDFEVDPISGITSVMSKLNQDEEVWIQMIIRPVGDEWQEKGHKTVTAVRAGKKVGTGNPIFGSVMKGLFGFGRDLLVNAVSPGADTTLPVKEIKLPASVEEALKSIEQKITKLGFETRVRILAHGNDSISVKLKCQNIAAAFKQFNTTNLNGFKAGPIFVDDEARLKDYLYRSYDKGGYIFNIAELASMYHFPSSSVATPNIVWSGSKKGEPPANLPIRVNVPPADFTVLGLTNFRNNFQEFGVKTDDRRRHVYIVGKSGTGKSTLIENMVINDINAGRGVIVVDPHGEMVDKIVTCIPDERKHDVIIFDPADREFPIAFNLLEAVDDDFKGLVASGFVGIFKKIFGESWGPRLEHILRNTVLALLDYPGSTMLDIPKMLTNSRFRDRVVEQVKDMVIREFWVNEFAQYDNKFRTEAVSPILNKVGQFLSSSTIRNIVGQPKSRLNIREVMDSEKIMLVNLSRGKIGEDNSALLGAMMITKIQLAAMSRADVEVAKRPDCFLYVDEFQNFATESFSTILSEARKYNLSLTIAHQYIAQMIEPVKDAVFGNAGTLIAFRVGGNDAETLVKEFAPVFDANDLVNLDKHQIYIKLLVDGIAAPAFSARTLPPVAKITGNYDVVRDYSRESYASARALTETMIEGVSKSDEDEAKKEAELFKTGGLEALLLKKSGGPERSFAPTPAAAPATQAPVQATIPTPVSQPVTTKPAALEEPPVKIVEEIAPTMSNTEIAHSPVSAPSTAQEAPVAEEKVSPEEPRTVKYQNIINGKLYKERTSRGNIKWYLGEEIDEEKLAKSNLVLDKNGRKMIDLSKRVGGGSTSFTNKAAAIATTDKLHSDSSVTHHGSESHKVHDNSPQAKADGDRRPQPNYSIISTAEKSQSNRDDIDKKPIIDTNKASTIDVSKQELPVVVEEHLPVVAVENLPTVVADRHPTEIHKEIVAKRTELTDLVMGQIAGLASQALKNAGDRVATNVLSSDPQKIQYDEPKPQSNTNNSYQRTNTYHDANHLEEGKPVSLKDDEE
jgi:hypothetical protein